jgi:hypothetical protein
MLHDLPFPVREEESDRQSYKENTRILIDHPRDGKNPASKQPARSHPGTD